MLRFVSIGQLLLFIVFLTNKQLTQQKVAASCFLLCIMGYLVLTAPTTDSESGLIRSISLAATELIPYTLWLFTYSLVNDRFKLKDLPFWIKGAIGLVLCWQIYFFGVQLGRGLFHQVSNLIAIALVIHVAYLVIKDWYDDLDDNIRKIRALLLCYICIYSALLISMQIINIELKDSVIFGLVNSLFVMLSIFFIGTAIIRFSSGPQPAAHSYKQDNYLDVADNKIKDDDDCQSRIPVIYKHAYQSLIETMESGYYTQTSLTISTLANELKMPEHQLRVLINQHLGFRNFSSFLNSYRLPAAKTQLADISKARVPILTIALNLGYGSIGPFNRAFKSAYNETPSDYRKSLLK